MVIDYNTFDPRRDENGKSIENMPWKELSMYQWHLGFMKDPKSQARRKEARKELHRRWPETYPKEYYG